MRILVVDDEKIVRKGIEKILKESFPLAVIDSVKNGQEGLEAIQASCPDILITDIRMPKMDGIELMQHISKTKQAPLIIVLSGYDEFEYAKKAILNGAKSYILKPIDKNELITDVSNCMDIIRKRKSVTIENLLKNVFNDNQIPKKNKAILPEASYVLVCTGIVSAEFLDLIKTISNCYVLENRNNALVLIINTTKIDMLKNFIQKCSITASISASETSYAEMKHLWRQAFIGYLNTLFSARKKNKALCVEYKSGRDISSDTKISAEITTKVIKLSLMIETTTQNELENCFKTIFKYIDDKSMESGLKLYYFYESVRTNILTRYASVIDEDSYLHIKKIMVENILCCNTFNDWKINLIAFVYYLNKYKQLVAEKCPFVFEAIAFMKEHFSEQINMVQVANQVSVNYTYFSEMFKKYTKMNFNRYLNLLRIEAAKNLLVKDCYKVYEIANLSGFGDVKYFMKKFKEETGMSPTQYKMIFNK